jgi:hypothetical protein
VTSTQIGRLAVLFCGLVIGAVEGELLVQRRQADVPAVRRVPGQAVVVRRVVAVAGEEVLLGAAVVGRETIFGRHDLIAVVQDVAVVGRDDDGVDQRALARGEGVRTGEAGVVLGREIVQHRC